MLLINSVVRSASLVLPQCHPLRSLKTGRLSAFHFAVEGGQVGADEELGEVSLLFVGSSRE